MQLARIAIDGVLTRFRLRYVNLNCDERPLHSRERSSRESEMIGVTVAYLTVFQSALRSSLYFGIAA